MNIRDLMNRPAPATAEAKPVEMKPRLPRKKPAVAPPSGPVIVPDGEPLVFSRLNGSKTEQVTTADTAAALADLRGHAWQISTLDGRVIAMSKAMQQAVQAGLKL